MSDPEPPHPADRPVRWGRSLLAFALLPAGLALLHLAAGRPDLVEAHYTGSVFPLIRDALTTLAAVLPLPLAQVGLLLLIGLLLLRVGRAVGGLLRRRRSPGNLLACALARTLALAGLAYAAFLLSWGLNHARLPYADHAGLAERLPPPEGVSVTELSELGGWLVGECNRLWGAKDPGPVALSGGERGVDPRLTAGYVRLQGEVPALVPGRPLLRRAFLSPALSRLGISGIYSPFTGECHVNAEVAAWLLPFSAAHELAHFHGFAREDEANFIAWQALRRTGDPGLEYAGTLAATANLLAALARHDRPAAEALAARLVPGVLDDLEQNRSFWRQRRTPVVTDLAEASNDAYLRSQGQEAGLRSYGRMVNLLVAERRRSLAGEGPPTTTLPTGRPPG